MNSRALTLALRLLATACGGVALGSMTACPLIFGCGDNTGWQIPVGLDLGGTSADLLAIAALTDDDGARYWSHIAVGTSGTIVAWGQDYSTSESFTDVFDFGDATLRGVIAVESGWWVVGDGGTLAVSQDRGQTWTPIDSGTTASLYAITMHGSNLVAVGDGVIVMQAADGTWSALTPPNNDWGQLRAVHSDGARIWAVGRGGIAWSSSDPANLWEAEATGLSGDLFGVCQIDYDPIVMVVGAQGSVALRSETGTWTQVDTGIAEDLIACSRSGVLASDGEVYGFNVDGMHTSIGNFDGARAIDYSAYAQLVTVGEAGGGQSMDYFECIGGRPFTVSGELQTAAVQASPDWCAPGADASPALAPDLALALAAAWAQDGLYEHASVASFARFGLELLALGAPPRLLADTQRAIADELHHAQLCFGLARRFGGRALGPGPMPIEPQAFARVGDVVATALALFEEGCVNESVAACEAAEAAETADDPEARRVLEIIAADERRHASLAWASLRWIVEHHGEQVREPLRARVAKLASSPLARDRDFDPRLGAFGRLAPSRRAQIQHQVITGVVRPLALAMLHELDGQAQCLAHPHAHPYT